MSCWSGPRGSAVAAGPAVACIAEPEVDATTAAGTADAAVVAGLQ